MEHGHQRHLDLFTTADELIALELFQTAGDWTKKHRKQATCSHSENVLSYARIFHLQASFRNTFGENGMMLKGGRRTRRINTER